MRGEIVNHAGSV